MGNPVDQRKERAENRAYTAIFEKYVVTLKRSWCSTTEYLVRCNFKWAIYKKK